MQSSFRPLFLLPLVAAMPVCARAAVVSDPAPPATLPDSGPAAPVVAIAFSPDGTLLYSLDESGELRARDLQNGKSRFRGAPAPGAAKLRVLAGGSLLVGLSNGGVQLVGKPVQGQPLAVKHFYVGDKPMPRDEANPLPLITLDGFVVSPDGTRLAVQTLETEQIKDGSRPKPGAKTARVRVWKLSDDQTPLEIGTFPADKGAPQLAWSEAQTLVVATSDVSLQRFDATSGAKTGEWKPPAGAAPKADPEKEEAEFQRRLQRMPERMRERALEAHERAKERAAQNPTDPNAAPDFGRAVGLSSDGKFVLAASRAGVVWWNTLDNTSRVLEKSERLGTLSSAQFSPDGRFVTLRGGARGGRGSGAFYLWNSDGTQAGFGSSPRAEDTDVAFAPDSSRVAMSDESGQVRVWNTGAALAKVADTTLPGFFQAWSALGATPDGAFAVSENKVWKIGATGAARVFENTPIEFDAALAPGVKANLRQNIAAFAASSDGTLWAEHVSFENFTGTLENAGVPRGELRARDAQTGAVLWKQSLQGFSTPLLRFLPDGTLLTGGRGGGIRLRGTPEDPLSGLQARDGKTGQPKDVGIEWGDKNGGREPGSVEILEPSANGKRLVVSSGSGGNGVQTVNLETKKPFSFFGANIEIPRGAWATSPDGRFLAGPSRTGVGVWDLGKERGFPNSFAPDFQLALSSPLPARLNAASWSATGALAAGFADGRVLVWTPDFAPDKAPTWETAPGRAITSLAWSSNGLLLIGDERGDLKTRSAKSGALESTIRLLAPASETAPPRVVRWTSDGKITPVATP